jgi:molecular chaperone IbpA
MNDLQQAFESLFKNTIGYDFLTDFTYRTNNFPPYDVIRNDEDTYTLQVALAGYGPDDVEVMQEDRKLLIRSVDSSNEKSESTNYLHRGIAKRKFSTALLLGEHVEVRGAKFENGLLVIELKRELPERLQPKKIPISSMSTLEYKPDEAA